ncbi:hypothetical protein TRFO_13630 [Tritrichomonas foetus]|uniref:GBD/FH3 domain-containing protein n=1 Tax=Tritrichomonas foetus TaxID=1144522 RepID=A0A1J4KXG8_9EUKA|nr:hypothetical protein TRFO_13630 [Tritrichomonas foetus]|eukprot:OHT15947.1 hypothetical protein TRFO_13630 [Tritrichomonas foetus]
MFKKKRSSKKLDENEEGLKETMVLYTIPKQMPSEEEVLSIFHNILNDLDMDKSKRIPLEAWSSIEKWNFIKLQIEQDKTTPTPDKVLFNLKNNLTLQELETLALHLSRLRISWCTRFIEIGGPKFLLTLLARLDNDIIVDEIVDDQLIINCLHCLKNLCNYTNGLREVSQYPHFIPNIINLMDPNQDTTIEYSLQILCSFLFSDYVQDSHLACESISRTIGKSLKFKTWIALYSGIHRNPQSSVSSVICSFLSGMWMAMFDDEDIRWEHVLRYKKFKIINELRKNSLQHELVKSLELEMKYLQLVFPQKLFNMFDNNEVITTLSAACQHPNIPHSVLLMCIELSQHDEKLFNNLMLYSHFKNCVPLKKVCPTFRKVIFFLMSEKLSIFTPLLF